MRMRTAVVAGALGAAAAVAMGAGDDLVGTELDQFTIHTGQFGQIIGGTYEYGTMQTYEDPGFPAFTYDVISPAGVAGFDHSIEYDFSDFAYTDFTGELGTVTIDEIALDVEDGSVAILGDDAETEIGFNYSDGVDSVEGDWNVDDALAFDPGGAVSVFVAWNSAGVDCPGDCNGDGKATIIDFVCFQMEWNNETDFGDCNDDGAYDVLDFVCYQVAFQDFAGGGCD